MISRLKCREIQAPVAKCLIREFANAIGYKKALKIAIAAIKKDAKISGCMVAKKYKGNGIKELARIVKDIWSKDGALTINVLEKTKKHFNFNIIRCRYAELYDTMGIRELGFCLSCSRDGSFVKGFNPKIKLSRTKTIMQGAPLCDFRFTLK
jgi:hypothetical protein